LLEIVWLVCNDAAASLPQACCNHAKHYIFISEMRNMPTPAEIRQLTANENPDEVWAGAITIIKRINPVYDFNFIHISFLDVLKLFRGEYPGYCPIKTPYHDLHHTLDVFLCSVRLMHGVHLSGNSLTDSEITSIMLATLLHDIGYAQRLEENEGTGAQFTLIHVGRGIQFMRQYLSERKMQPAFATTIECLMNSTNPGLDFNTIAFPDQRTRLLAQIVGTADIVGQMADRTYLEKLLFLYIEFKEAHFGNYTNLHDLLRQTKSFYETTKVKKLEGTFESVYKNFIYHFSNTLGADKNFYLAAIESNIDYLSKVIAMDESESLSMLKRGGIMDKSLGLPL
jgi:hypothetical protein